MCLLLQRPLRSCERDLAGSTCHLTYSTISLPLNNNTESLHDLTISSLNLLLSSSSITSRELLSQFSTCSGWMIWCGLKIKENYHVLVNQFHGNFRSKTLCWRKITFVSRDLKWWFNASWGLQGLSRRKGTLLLWNMNTQKLRRDRQVVLTTTLVFPGYQI